MFNAVQVVACLYALRRGGGPERWTAGTMAAGAAATALALQFFRIETAGVNRALLLVDLAVLIGLTALAARANRFWPMWVAALQLLAIAVHFVAGLDNSILPAVYNQTLGKVAYPMILLLVVGTYRHHRRCRLVAERDWSPFRW